MRTRDRTRCIHLNDGAQMIRRPVRRSSATGRPLRLAQLGALSMPAGGLISVPWGVPLDRMMFASLPLAPVAAVQHAVATEGMDRWIRLLLQPQTPRLPQGTAFLVSALTLNVRPVWDGRLLQRYRHETVMGALP
jgi:hypothetical protein